MGAFQRVYLYITRKKARSLLLLILLWVMGLFLLAGLSIRAGARKAAEDVRKTITTGIEIEMIPIAGDKVYDLSYNEKGELVRTVKLPLLAVSNLKQLLEIEGVKGYFTEMGHEIVYTGLDVHPGGYARTLEEIEEQDPEGLYNDLEEMRSTSEAYLHCNGVYLVNDSQWHPFFTNGALELTKGRHIELGDEGKAIISEELARRNGLGIGDIIESYRFDFLTSERYGSPFESEIVGIYKINFEQDLSNWTSEDAILANVIFADPSMDYWSQAAYNTYAGRDVLARESDGLLGNVTLFVEEPAMLESVEEKVKALDLADWKYYTFRRYDQDYKAAAKPVSAIVTLSTILVVIIFAGTFLILSLILTMWIRSRRREIGILMSIGVKKKGILAQFILECCMVAIVAFLLSGLMAAPLTNAVGRIMQRRIDASASQEGYEASVDYQSNITVNKLPSGDMTLEYGLRPATVLLVFAAMALVSMASVIAASRQILKQKPREALKGG
ncbi:MAG: ABC transporter permease [Lachnospiraceae bacterium]|jgi:putative ABC transport system permease protein|nr:ABC transporter permease [Lachnospiraceae bacterium]